MKKLLLATTLLARLATVAHAESDEHRCHRVMIMHDDAGHCFVQETPYETTLRLQMQQMHGHVMLKAVVQEITPDTNINVKVTK